MHTFCLDSTLFFFAFRILVGSLGRFDVQNLFKHTHQLQKVHCTKTILIHGPAQPFIGTIG